MNSSSNSEPLDIQKCIQQVERKREYNKAYYHSKVKVKRENEKKEYDVLKEKYNKLENYIMQIETGMNKNSEKLLLLSEHEKQIKDLTNANLDLTQKLLQSQREIDVLQQSLEIARKRNYELIIKKSNELLPNIQNLSL